jgi:hypothetical protein
MLQTWFERAFRLEMHEARTAVAGGLMRIWQYNFSDIVAYEDVQGINFGVRKNREYSGIFYEECFDAPKCYAHLRRPGKGRPTRSNRL